MTITTDKKLEYKFYRQFKNALKKLGTVAYIDRLNRIRAGKDLDESIHCFCPITLVYYARFKKVSRSSNFIMPSTHLKMPITLTNSIAGAADESDSIIYKRVRKNLLRIAGLK